MIVGIMQPYFLPYLGYWQLMNAVDQYVIYDDVNYIKGGRINRNAILINSSAQNINLLLQKASRNRHINEITLLADAGASRNKLAKTFEMAYHKAPYWNEVAPYLKEILEYSELNLALFLKNSFEIIGSYLGINTEFLLSSSIDKNNELRGEWKVYEICKLLNATEYYNSIGGYDLYSKEKFEEQGIHLSFLKMKDIQYKQFNSAFVPNLSIIDVMMFNSKDQLKHLLTEYEII